jgi:hypothetical protein
VLQSAGVAEKAVAVAAFPVVFWFNVGKLVSPAALKTGAVEYAGVVVDPVKFPNTLPAGTVDNVKVRAGVDVGADPSEVVNSGESGPDVKLLRPPAIAEQVPLLLRYPVQDPDPNNPTTSENTAVLDNFGAVA